MIISKTPYRISFFGGGTDYPCWYENHGGQVLSAAIDRYCYITCRYLPPFFDHKYRIAYSIIEDVKSINDIKHPAVRETLRYMEIENGVEIHHDGDLPKQTGLGTSSSFTVGLLNALHALRNEMSSPEELAREAIHVERNLCNENVGSQDQYAAAYGGINHILFKPGGGVHVRPLIVDPDRISELNRHLLLMFTGFSRYSSHIAAEQVINTHRREKELNTMYHMVDEALSVLTSKRPIREFGKLMNESWALKKALSTKISNPEIDAIYEEAIRAGSDGGKLCGAGGGGFMLLFVAPEFQQELKARMKRFLFVPFGFDQLGSHIVFCQPTSDALRERR